MTICIRCEHDREEAFFFRKGRIWKTCIICSENGKTYHRSRNGEKRSVGNRGNNRVHEPRIASARRVWYANHYKASGLSLETFLEMSQHNCYYCGEKPSNIMNYFQVLRDRGEKVSDYGVENGNFIYNGIDKKNYELGYTKDNIVPCCWKCNRMKQRLNDQEFINQCTNVANHQKIMY